MSHDRYILRASERTTQNEESQSHPWNPRSLVRGHTLSEKSGLKRIGIHQLTIPPGKESFVFHSHQSEEEWIYVLAGRALVDIEDQTHEVGPGDFVGFPAPSVAHHLRNPFDGDFVYLSGGERREIEIADFPRLQRRMVRTGAAIDIFPMSARKGFTDFSGGGEDP